jgi:short-subunit dehydrogenase
MRGRKRSMVRNAAYLGVGLVCAAADAYLSRSRRLRGSVVVITGGSRGLGLALAEELGRRGARLALVARDRYELDRARQILFSSGAVGDEAGLLALSADLRSQKDAEGVIEQATKQFGRVDVLINNAGIITVGPIENQTIEQFRDVMETNFFAALHCTLAVLPQMLQRGDGSIANITSIGGKVAVPHMLPYTASKFAAVGFSEGLCTELRAKGIRVTTVVPGLMRTGSHRNALFTGDASSEYRWFSLAANLPGASAAAGRAARQIAHAIGSGAAEVTITPQALLASRFASVAPGLTRCAMSGMQFLLPAARPGESRARRGEEVRDQEWFFASAMGSLAARRYNQTGTVSS